MSGRGVAASGHPSRHKGMRTWWLILDRPEVDLCLTDPGWRLLSRYAHVERPAHAG